MSLLVGHVIREQIARDIRAAWPKVTAIVFGRPVGDPPAAPYARVDMPEVAYEPLTVSQTEQRYVFAIGLVAPLKPRQVVADLQESAANALIERLMAEKTYSEAVAYMPRVNRVLFAADYTDEPTYEVAVEFECRLSVPYVVG